MNQQTPYSGNTGQQMPSQQTGYQDPYALPQSQPYQDPAAFHPSTNQNPYVFQQPTYQSPNPYPQQSDYQDPNAYAQQANFQSPAHLPQQMTYQNQIPALQPAPPQQPVAQPPSASKGKSGFGIAGLTLGIVALATSFVPIINNGSFVLAILGAIFGAVGVQQARKGTRSGLAVSRTACILCAIAFLSVMFFQRYYTSVLDDALTTSGKVVSSSSASAVSSSSAQSSASSSASSSSSAATSTKSTANMPLGTYVNVGNGLQVTVNSVTPGLTRYDGSEVVAVNVTYKNTGKSAASFNLWDWKAESSQGVQTSTTFYSGEEDLGYGTLAPDGTVTGNIYFDPDVVKVLYYNSIFSKDTTISWLA